jgi:uncharacterized protein YcsI (UPF0317 family)
MLLHDVDRIETAMAATAVDQISTIFVELVHAALQIEVGDVLGVWDITGATFGRCTHVQDSEVRIFFVVLYELLGLLD